MHYAHLENCVQFFQPSQSPKWGPDRPWPIGKIGASAGGNVGAETLQADKTIRTGQLGSLCQPDATSQATTRLLQPNTVTQASLLPSLRVAPAVGSALGFTNGVAEVAQAGFVTEATLLASQLKTPKNNTNSSFLNIFFFSDGFALRLAVKKGEGGRAHLRLWKAQPTLYLGVWTKMSQARSGQSRCLDGFVLEFCRWKESRSAKLIAYGNSEECSSGSFLGW